MAEFAAGNVVINRAKRKHKNVYIVYTCAHQTVLLYNLICHLCRRFAEIGELVGCSRGFFRHEEHREK